MKLELRSIRVKNCGPLDDVRVEFYDEQGKTLPVCVLAGANGSGKTTILEVIAQLFRGIAGRMPLEDVPSLEYAQLDLLVNGCEFNVALGKKPVDATLAEEYFFHERILQKEEGIEIYTGRFQGDLAKKLSQQIYAQAETERDLLGFVAPSTNGERVPGLLYFPHTRSLEIVNGSQVTKEVFSYELVHKFDVVRSFAGSLVSYLIWLDYADPDKFRAVQEFLNELDFEGKTFHVQRKTLDVMVRTRDGHEHKLHELSSGEQNLLILLMELRRRLLPHSIVLIDEIENSLHPAYQHKLAQALLKMQQMIPFQLIVTTHSWEIAEIFGASATRVLTNF